MPRNVCSRTDCHLSFQGSNESLARAPQQVLLSCSRFLGQVLIRDKLERPCRILMGAFSKTFWITIAASIPFILWALVIAQSRGQGITVPAIQFLVLVVGVIFIWREGERILDAVTTVWERVDLTRVWDSVESPSIQSQRQNRAPLDRHNMVCAYCGYEIPSEAVYCRRCGRRRYGLSSTE